MKQSITHNGVTMNTTQTNGVNMLNPTPAEINRICNRMTAKATICEAENGNRVEVFALKKGGYLVSVEEGEYAYWTSDINVAVRLWMAAQENDTFWQEALIEFGGEPDADQYIDLHQYDAYDGFKC